MVAGPGHGVRVRPGNADGSDDSDGPGQEGAGRGDERSFPSCHDHRIRGNDPPSIVLSIVGLIENRHRGQPPESTIKKNLRTL